MLIRKAKESEIETICGIYEQGRAFMRGAGNEKQWVNGYPGREDVMKDLADGTLYVLCDGEEIACVFCCMTREEPTYGEIFDGEWKRGGDYATVHRIATADGYRGRGMSGLCFDFALSLCGSVRADTHRDNIPMQKALLKNGFEYCGIIYLQNGDERLAYQRTAKTETGELLSLLDENGVATGRSLPRGQKPAPGDYRHVVHIVILSDDGRMLIQQRQFFKSGWPGMWDVTVGGGVLAGESGGEAAQRELSEEIGLQRPLAGKRPSFRISFDIGFDDFFILRENVDISSLRLQPEEVRAVRWADCGEIISMIDSGEFIPYKKEFLRLLFVCGDGGMLETPNI